MWCKNEWVVATSSIELVTTTKRCLWTIAFSTAAVLRLLQNVVLLSVPYTLHSFSVISKHGKDWKILRKGLYCYSIYILEEFGRRIASGWLAISLFVWKLMLANVLGQGAGTGDSQLLHVGVQILVLVCKHFPRFDDTVLYIYLQRNTSG